MPKVAPLQNDFSAGEISPRILGRVDADSYKRALEICKNYIPYTQGPLTRRPGSVYVSEVKTSADFTTIVPFVVSETESYLLEFGDGYIRFFKNNAPVLDGGSPYEVTSTGITPSSTNKIQHAQIGDIMYLVETQSSALRKLTRNGDTDWELETVSFNEPYYLALNNAFSDYQSEAYRTMTLTPSATSGPSITLTPGPEQAITAAVNSGGGSELTVFGHGFQNGDTISVVGSSEATLLGTAKLEAGGSAYVINANKIQWGGTVIGSYSPGMSVRPAPFTVGNNVFVRLLHGSTWGWGQLTSVSSTSNQATMRVDSNFGATSAAAVWRIQDTDSPSCVTFHEDRLALSGFPNSPGKIVLSRTGRYEDFGPTGSSGVTDDSGISFSLLASDVNQVKSMVSMEKGLFAGTIGGEWIIRPSSAGEALTPSNVNANRSTTFGTTDDQAAQVGNAVIFIQKTGKKVRDSIYSFQLDGFRSNDLTLLSESITRNGVRKLAYQKDPVPIVWMVREDGTLVGMNYERLDDQAVRFGFHRHELGGTDVVVEDVAVIPSPDGRRDELWVVVKRTIDGNTVRYIEYFSKIYEDVDAQEDIIMLDSTVTYDSSATSTITGLDHLEGETVAVLADGAVQNSKTVSSGQITLDEEASVVQVGLAYNSDAKLLRFEAGSANGTALGKTRRTHRVGIMFHKTLGVKIGPSFENLTEIIFRTAANNTNEAVPLYSGIKSETFDADYDFENSICIRQSGPLPGTILAVLPQLTVNDR